MRPPATRIALLALAAACGGDDRAAAGRLSLTTGEIVWSSRIEAHTIEGQALVDDQLLFEAQGPCREPGADGAVDATTGDEVEPRFAASRLLATGSQVTVLAGEDSVGAFATADASPLWSFALTEPRPFGRTPAASVLPEHVLVADPTEDETASDVYGLDAVTGELLWQRSFPGFIELPPGSAADSALLLDLANDPGTFDITTLHVIDPATGVSIWSQEIAAHGARSNGRVLVREDRLRHVDVVDLASGELLWEVNGDIALGVDLAVTVELPPDVDPDIGPYTWVARDPLTGEERWHAEHEGWPAFVGEALLSFVDGQLTAFSSETGEPIWSRSAEPLVGTLIAGPAGDAFFIGATTDFDCPGT
jgi:outer membrane protein assembly factor BamB